ncbi:hypothetical protein [Variovorax sp. OV700]|uniref:hypothetical protein n=1 Tax=Variovorax sp. OV700 TaxID=1882826 RepID=UPI0008814111|nr:hypothetical protein [Variovorax sp. OV700]SDJ64012.1 hypothetical protein SAMN05444748_11767 [Variovorax sp. OV700]
MSKPEETPFPRNHALVQALAWISKFAHAWKAIEPAPHRLSIDGFIIWGPALYEKHGKDDPVALAARLYGKSGEYSKYLYPAHEPDAGEALPF